MATCEQCGAELPEGEAGESVECGYCQSACLLVDGHLEGVILEEKVGQYDCPCCHVPLTGAMTQDIRIEVCESCHGILFPPATFLPVVRARRQSWTGGEIVPRPVDHSQIIPRRYCPECGGKMDCHPYYGPGNAIIDSCPSCFIIWLDSGELTHIERAAGER